MSGPAPGRVVGRFAPSPTGAMHLGNLRTALLAWLQVRAAGERGRFLLRFEDLDTGRVRPWAYDVTRRDLEWLGLHWDEEIRQSERLEVYGQALARLDTYPCTCTRREVLAASEASVGAPHGEEAVYPGTCRAGCAHPERPAAIRWRVGAGEDGAEEDCASEICADDALSGERLCQNLRRDIGDFTLRRGDGAYAYHLAVVVDDAESGVTDVLRGADLWRATPRQVALQRALGLPTPRYWHVPLMTDFRGERLAKRGGAPSVQALREGGEDPGRLLASLAASLGWSVPPSVQAAELLPSWERWVTGFRDLGRPAE